MITLQLHDVPMWHAIENPICGVGQCRKLLGKVPCAASSFVASYCERPLCRAPSCGDSGSPHSLHMALIWRFRLIIYLKHAPSCGDSQLSCILNMPHSLAIPGPVILRFRFIIYRILNTRPLMWRCRFLLYLKHDPPPPSPHVALRFITCLKHAPSLGDSGSSVHHITVTCARVWRFRFIIYPKHAFTFGDSGSSDILNTCTLMWRFRVVIYHISSTRTFIWRLRFIIYL